MATVSTNTRGLYPAQAGGTATAALSPTVIHGFFAESPHNAFTVTARGPDDSAFVREAVVYLPRNTRVPYLFLVWRQRRFSTALDDGFEQ